MEAHVGEHEHTRSDRAEQAADPGLLVVVVGPHPRVADGMGARLTEGDQLGLGPGTGAPRGGTATEGSHVGLRIGQIDHGAVEGHEPQPEEKGTGGIRRGQRLADAMEQADQGLGTEAIACLADGALGDPQVAGVRPEPAESLHQAPEHGGQGVVGIEIHGDAQDERRDGRQLAVSLLLHAMLGDHLGQHRRGNDVPQRIQGKVGGERLVRPDLAYHRRHGGLQG